MPLINRNFDATQQRIVFQERLISTDLTNGASGMIAVSPFTGTIDAGAIVLYGISGAPQFQISVNRTGGAGATFIVAAGSSNVPLAMGTSGAWQIVLPASGSTLLNVSAGDAILWAQTGGTGAAAVSALVSIVLRPIQDIRTQHGV